MFVHKNNKKYPSRYINPYPKDTDPSIIKGICQYIINFKHKEPPPSSHSLALNVSSMHLLFLFFMKRKRPVDSLEDAAKRCRAQVIPEDAPIGQVSSKNEDFVMRAGSFDVILVIDQREVQNHKDSTAVLTTSLQAAHIPFTFRTLPIGDFTWICKHREQGISH